MLFLSPSINQGKIPKKFTCDGKNVNPLFLWQSQVSNGIKTFAIVVDDPDAVPVSGSVHAHFAIVNIPSFVQKLVENFDIETLENEGALVLNNDSHTTGYSGPCPPPGSPHTYRFALYALNKRLPITNRNTRLTLEIFEGTFQKNIISKASFEASYQR